MVAEDSYPDDYDHNEHPVYRSPEEDFYDDGKVNTESLLFSPLALFTSNRHQL